MSGRSGKDKDRKSNDEMLEFELSSVVEVSEENNRFFGNMLSPEDKDVLTYRQLIFRQQVRQAAAGNTKPLQDMTDRMLGKTVQVTENLNMEVSYMDFLDDIADAEEREQLESGQVIDSGIVEQIESVESDLFQ